MFLNEGLRVKDLQHLVSNYVSIDQYTTKMDEDNITVAFFVNERDAIEELRDFIEKTYVIEIRDIEISESMTSDNKYILFVELERNIQFPKILMDMIESINYVSCNKDWKFISFGTDEYIDLDLENIKKHVRLSKLRDSAEEVDETEEETEEDLEESYLPSELKINDGGWDRIYLPEGYITEEKMNKIISESDSLNDRDPYELELLETTFPGSEIITTDKNVFVITGDKILMLS